MQLADVRFVPIADIPKGGQNQRQYPRRMWFADLPSARIALCGPSIASNPYMLTVKHQG